MPLSDLPVALVTSTAIAVGLCFGSFLNVVIHRLPRGMNLAYPPSACPGCGTPIRALHNVPVLGWLWLRGRAACCGVRISPRYPLVEALGGLLAWALVVTRILPFASEVGVGMAVAWFATWLALGLGLVALAFIDLEFMILPDSLTLGGAALGLASSLYRADIDWQGSLLGGVFGFGLVWLPFIWGHRKLRGFDGMGLGDAKLLLLAGCWFGVLGAAFVLFAGAIQGTLATLVTLLVHGEIKEPAAVTAEREELARAIEEAEGEEREELVRLRDEDPLGHEAPQGLAGARIPFGPFLALACLEFALFEGHVREALSLWTDGVFG
ncbi:MAG TPA: prepilin peptidase [Polyangiaceae bacterium]|nr:prepilin peptidase [Polyangiaceae bacterium]